MPKVIDWSGGKRVVRDQMPEEILPITVAAVEAEMARRLRGLVADYPEEERETFWRQVEQARAVMADPQAAAPIIRARATARDMTVAEMASRVLYLAEQLDIGTGRIMSKRDVLVATDPIPRDYTADKHWTE